ncbi:Rrf2 family transcriptional regulator [Rickettsiales bacterium]|nr:Rrf2 family transcriptional regulator [Rickettsiales bacterium]
MLPCKFAEALEAVLYVAVHSKYNPVRSRDVCDYQNLSSRHLEPIMQALVRGGILKGTKGPKGGYTLAREKRKIFLAEIYKIIFDLEFKDKSFKTPLRVEVIAPFMCSILGDIENDLNKTTIDDLYRKSAAAEKVSRQKSDFAI